MVIILASLVSVLIAFLAISAMILYVEFRGKNIKVPFLRQVGALVAIEDTIGRCAEMGKAVFYGTGGTGVFIGSTGSDFDQFMSSFEILRWVTRIAARYKTNIFCAVSSEQTIALHTDVMEEAYKSENAQELFRPENVHWYGGRGDHNMYSAGCALDLNEIKPGTSIQMGPISADALFVQDEARKLEAITITGTARLFSIPLTFLTSDYCLWGEEMISAAAYLSNDPKLKASLRGADIGRLITIALIVIGAILLNSGFPIIANLLKM